MRMKGILPQNDRKRERRVKVALAMGKRIELYKAVGGAETKEGLWAPCCICGQVTLVKNGMRRSYLSSTLRHLGLQGLYKRGKAYTGAKK